MSNILVTGDKGFIGSNLKKILKFDGFDILDGFDITDSKQVKSILPDYEYVVNLAAVSDVDSCAKYTEKAYRTNVVGAINILKYAKKSVFISSASVYDDTGLPSAETSPLFPKSYYGMTKVMMEYAISGFLFAKPKPCVILRPFNITGSGSKGVLEVFKNSKELNVYGDPYRDFVNVSDVCKAITLAIDNVEYCSGEPFNVGTGTTTSILEVAQSTGKEYELLDKKKNDIQYSCADVSKIKNEWGFGLE